MYKTAVSYLSIFFLVVVLSVVSGAQTGLVAYWTADGNTNDIAGGNNATFQGAALYASGKNGQAFSLDGTNYLQVPDSSSLSMTGPLTLSAWIRTNRNDIQQGIIEKYDVPALNGYLLRITDGGKVQFTVCDTTTCSQPPATGSTTISTGVWHNVAGVYDGTTIKVYLDGVLEGTSNTTFVPTDGAATLKIGARGDDANTRFNGLIDEVRIYNRALSASEVPAGDGPPATIHNIADGDVAGLIAAINTANACACPTTINLAPNGNYTLTGVADYGLGEAGAQGPAGLPYIRSQITINGNGATVERSSAPGTPDFVLVEVSSSNSGDHHAYNANLNLNGLILRGGSLGGLHITHGTASVSNSTITQNSGGGINNYCGRLNVVNSTISFNTMYNNGYGGGGIFLFSPCFGADGVDPALAYISSSTIFENRSDVWGRGESITDAFGRPGDVVVKNSILASPTRGAGTACYGELPESEGYNIAGDNSCGLTGSGDINNTNPLLGPLANNGGPTPTHALLSGSPAIDAIPLADCTTVAGVAVSLDQRGLPRPFGSGCDIGAYESQVPTDSTPPLIVPTVTGTLGNNGWYVSNVDVSWQVTDPESPFSNDSGCAATQVAADTTGVTFTCSATSAGGTSTGSVMIKRDTTRPNVSCGTADGAWHAADIAIACSANDSISGLSAPGDAGFNLTTSVPAGTETVNATTNSRQVCDNAGNCSSAGPVSGNKIDKKAPVITITSPAGGSYLLNQAVTVNYTCSDDGSSVASCTGTVPNGGQLNTAATGNLAFTVNAVDNAGNTAQPVVVNYVVNVGLVVLFDQTKASKSGSTVPIKIRLVDANGANVSSATNVVHAVNVIQTSSQATTTLDDSGNSNPDFDFRYDAATGGYIFNLKTTGYGTGSYLLNFVVGNSPTIYSVGFQVRQ